MPWRQSPLTRSEWAGCLIFVATMLFLLVMTALLAFGPHPV